MLGQPIRGIIVFIIKVEEKKVEMESKVTNKIYMIHNIFSFKHEVVSVKQQQLSSMSSIQRTYMLYIL